MTDFVRNRLSQSRYIFPIFSDMHTDSLEAKHFCRQLALLSSFAAEYKSDALISLGDFPAMLGRQQHASNERIIELLSGGAKMLSSTADAPLLAINGNHDGIGTDFFSPELWNEAIGVHFERGLGRHDGKAPYFFADFGEYRFIFLSIPHGCDLECELPTPLWSLGKDQLEWLEALMSASGEKRVIIFSHVPICSEYLGDPAPTLAVWDGKRERRATIASLCGWIDDRAEVERIINSFADKNPGKLLFAVGGHEHFDAAFKSGETRSGMTNRLVCPQIIVSSHPKYARAPELLFEKDELSIVCINVEDTPSLKLLCIKAE